MGNYVKQKITVTDSDWVPLVSSIDCDYFGLKNSGPCDLLIRTDVNDANTEDTLAAGNQESVSSAYVRQWDPTTRCARLERFVAGIAICHLKAVGSFFNHTASAVATFID